MLALTCFQASTQNYHLQSDKLIPTINTFTISVNLLSFSERLVSIDLFTSPWSSPESSVCTNLLFNQLIGSLDKNFLVSCRVALVGLTNTAKLEI